MNKTKKMKKAARQTRVKNIKNYCNKILSYPVKWAESLWNWLKSIDIVGMINMTLLVAIIVLFSSLISDVLCCRKYAKVSGVQNTVVATPKKTAPVKDNRRVVQRKFNTALPIKMDKQTNIKPKIKVVGVPKPQIVRELSLPAKELPQQNLSGDVIVDILPNSPVLSNGVKIDGNLFIQNMRKFTLPCDAKINGNLFVRNVDKLSFCGAFTVTGNIYVNRQSSFGPIPRTARIGGQVVL